MSRNNKKFEESFVNNKCLSIESNFYLPVIKDVQSLLKLQPPEERNFQCEKKFCIFCFKRFKIEC